jgi:hypothetical protein
MPLISWTISPKNAPRSSSSSRVRRRIIAPDTTVMVALINATPSATRVRPGL